MQRITTILPYERFKILSYIVVSFPFALMLIGTLIDGIMPGATWGGQNSMAFRIQMGLYELFSLIFAPALFVINWLYPPEELEILINGLIAMVCTIIWLTMVPFFIARVVYKRTLGGIFRVTIAWLVITIATVSKFL